ncbi:GGDEF domain-containing protein [Devosia naphthalenivorans]|uniref:GGDEF domain-containing protein n=1 Tax=Devosia naphthalenivorans TaxID=2082392 RepID=UPI0013B04D25|nr:GGDEF domain-containing protein [Devosia naphthalenivorans]
MLFDYQSLLLAILFSGGAMSLTLLAAWFAAKNDKFLLTWSAGMLVLTAAVGAFNFYAETLSPYVGAFSFVLLTSGLAVVYGAARQFRRARAPFGYAAAFGAPTAVLVTVPFLLGYAGIGIIIANLFSGLMLVMAAALFWQCRSEARGLIAAMCGLYVAAGISFALCGLVLLAERRFVLVGMPDNWAEDLNVMVSLMGITGIGAISTALNHSRLAQRHLLEARTDTLTGLVNRRSLLDTHATLEPQTALIAFDLDNFKSVNDRYGHAVGDRLLVAFANCIIENLPPEATGARIGGEEFVAILPRTAAATAVLVAEKIREAFETTSLRAEDDIVQRTVSAGVAATSNSPGSFEDVLRRADDALYVAKRDGRNRVRVEGPRLVA